MKVLIACEESQTGCKAFRAKGHEAYSCDIQDQSGGHPEWHIKGDALKILRGGEFETTDGERHCVPHWDLVIAHPPCTYLSNAGACRLYPKKGELNKDRYIEGLKAKLFFMAFWYYGWFGCGKIVIENPMPSSIYELPKPTDVIQPYQFGHPYSKKTYLWEFGVQPLMPTMLTEVIGPYVPSGTGRKDPKTYGAAKRGDDRKERSKSFPGILEAMAEQWGGEE